MIISQLIVNGLIAGATYALIAASFSIIFNSLKFMDLSPGAFFVIAAFSVYSFHVIFGLDLFIAILIALLIVIIVALLVNMFVYRPLRKKKANSFIMLLVSFGVFLFLTGVILLIFGAELRSLGFPIVKGYEFFGIIITKFQIILVLTSLIIFALLNLFMKETKIGKAMRAVSDNKDIASTLGINFERFTNVIYAVSAILVGIAGVLIAVEQNLNHDMGFTVVLKGITASVVGGIGNIPAALIGGFLIGIVENLGIWFLPSGYKDAISFFILVLFLLFRPRGLFGVKTREEVSG